MTATLPRNTRVAFMLYGEARTGRVLRDWNGHGLVWLEDDAGMFLSRSRWMHRESVTPVGLPR